MGLFCGIDWAEGHHDVALVDDDGKLLAKLRIGTGAEGFSDLVASIATLSAEPSSVPVAIETDKNLIVVALHSAGYVVYPINPRAVARYRERHSQAGGKSDPGDAVVRANILRTDQHNHRPLPANSEQALAVRALARQHQEANSRTDDGDGILQQSGSTLLSSPPLETAAEPGVRDHPKRVSGLCRFTHSKR